MFEVADLGADHAAGEPGGDRLYPGDPHIKEVEGDGAAVAHHRSRVRPLSPEFLERVVVPDGVHRRPAAPEIGEYHLGPSPLGQRPESPA